MIKEIQIIYMPIQPVYSKSTSFISRDSWIRFFLTLFFSGVFGMISKALLAFLPEKILLFVGILGFWAAVETSDYVWHFLIRGLDLTFDYILPGIGLLVIAALVIVFKYFPNARWLTDLPQNVKAWHKAKNEELQQNKTPIRAFQPSSGGNWQFIVNADENYTYLTGPLAQVTCEGLGHNWHLPDNSEFEKLTPPPKVAKTISVWLRGGTSAAQVSGELSKAPQVFSTGSPEQTNITLCVKE